MINGILDAILPLGEWFVLTCFDTLVYYDPKLRELRHDDVAISPRNLMIVSSSTGISIRVARLQPTAAEQFELSTEELPEISMANAGLDRNVAFYRGNRLATAHPDGPITFDRQRIMTWEVFRLVHKDHLDRKRYWKPATPQGGTQVMLARLANTLGPDLERINLKVNSLSQGEIDLRPLVVWIHNSPNPVYDWCNNSEVVAKVSRFVFVSDWQQQKFMEAYRLPPGRCVVIRNATITNDATRAWPTHDQWRWRCAYISAPMRGLNVLLAAWNDLSPENAELHIWSGTDLWRFKGQEFRPIFSQAMESSDVHFHRIAPNSEIRAALLDMHFLLYPCTENETFCISVVEAMAAGCRIIASSRGALPETAAGFARLYPSVEDFSQHKNVFMKNLADELNNPWRGQTELAVAQQDYCRIAYGWTRHAEEWRHLIDELSGG
jgi:glycosyltransferase involved in cell wall biosynthesis